jgi:hypothetical protein
LVFENIEAFYVEKDKCHGLNFALLGKILPNSGKEGFCCKLKREPKYASADCRKGDRL